MQIKDLETKTGLDRATIRFYEKEGLIAPLRQENGYRCYREEDAQTLLKIKLLRQLGMSLDRIKGLQQGSVEFQAAMEEQRCILEQRLRETEQAREICRIIREDGSRYETLDAERYLKLLSQPKAVDIQPKEPFREPGVIREYHPVRRFLGRMLDYMLLECLIQFLLIVVLRVRPFGDILSWVVDYGAMFLLVPLDALMLHLWGTTPGKWVMGLRIEHANGGKLPLQMAVEREWEALRHGMGWGIPIWELWRLYRCYKEYGERPQMDWDWQCEYIYEKWKPGRKAAAGVMAAVLGVMILISAGDSIKPSNRGAELTVEDFAENYNFYLDMLYEDHALYEELNPDGTTIPVDNSVYVIYTSDQPEKENPGFLYKTENGYLRSVTYENRWTEIFAFSPVNQKCLTALYSIMLAQNGIGLQEMIEISELLDEKLEGQQGQIVYGNLEITWHLEAENCEKMGSMYFAADDSAPSSIEYQFTITICE